MYNPRGAIDLHTHSDISDGTDTPAELVAKAHELGLAAVALTDHDTFDGLDEAQAKADELGFKLIRGVEVSAQHHEVSVHLLGYQVDETHPGLLAAMAFNRKAKDDRAPQILAKLAELGMPLTMDEVEEFSIDDSAVQRPHIADAMVAKGYVANRDEAFAKYLHEEGPAYQRDIVVELEDAIAQIHAAGGLAVIAHPWARASIEVLTAAEFARLAAEFHLDGIEVDYPDHTPEQRAELHAIAANLGLFTTGSSDYHGTGKTGHFLGEETTSPDLVRALGL
ncbi:MAG: PHP domain-containing protein [Propionibacteriaceae bacterium]|jgi:predicted metal-dependent phosphoesterase TrpH|nr:PHP domain-containing protein [Propionibacteriaceae bacterium]